jgi:hypothetical protein
LDSTHDCFLLDGRIARFSLTSGITGHFAKEAIGVAPAGDAPEGVDVAGGFGAKKIAIGMSYLNEPSGLPRRIISWQ